MFSEMLIPKLDSSGATYQAQQAPFFIRALPGCSSQLPECPYSNYDQMASHRTRGCVAFSYQSSKDCLQDKLYANHRAKKVAPLLTSAVSICSRIL